MAQSEKDAALRAYRDLKPPEGDSDTAHIAQGGEGQHAEFKATFAWDVRQGQANDHLKTEVFKTVAAFANAHGGTLLIGVTDAGHGVGLARDLSLRPQAERTRDKFELYLRAQLRSALSPDVGEWLRVSFPVLDGHEVCRLDVRAAHSEVFVGHDFYARFGNETRKLQGMDLTRYVRGRWPGK